MRGVGNNLVSPLHGPAVVDVLKHWLTTFGDPLCCSEYEMKISNPVVKNEVRVDLMVSL